MLLALSSTSATARDQVTFGSDEKAFRQGVAAYKSGYYGIAIPALKQVTKRSTTQTQYFPARYYLARIFSDPNGGHTNHGRACELLLEFVKQYGETDSADYRRAKTVADAMTRFAVYVKKGCPGAYIPPSLRHAFDYMHYAATYFDYDRAQFELAKLRLGDHGRYRSIREGLNWLAKLVRERHPPAQALLAEHYWNGEHVRKDRVCALALATVALKGARAEDQIWIEELHHGMFCATGDVERNAVREVLAAWLPRYRRRQVDGELDRLSTLGVQPARYCHTGELVLPLKPLQQPYLGSPGGGVWPHKPPRPRVNPCRAPR